MSPIDGLQNDKTTHKGNENNSKYGNPVTLIHLI